MRFLLATVRKITIKNKLFFQLMPTFALSIAQQIFF